MPVIEFAGQSSRDADNAQNSPQRLVNCYREPTGGRSGKVIKSVLGTTALVTLDGVFLRAMTELNGFVYVVHGGRLLRLSSGGDTLDQDGLDDDPQTFMSSNNGSVTIAANGKYYVWNGTSMLTPANLAFTLVADVAFMGQRTVLLEKGGRKVQWSSLAAPATLDATNFATTEQRDDNNLRVFENGGLLWIFKERSIERWQNTGAGFSYLPGSLIERGLKSASLAAQIPDGVFFVGNDGLPYIAQAGGITQPLSGGNRAVETALSTSEPTHCLYHEDEGAKHCVIRFADRPAWVLNLSTGEWHERAGYLDDPWSAICSVRAFGVDLVGMPEGGIHRLERVTVDAGEPLVRTMVSKPLRLPDRPRGFRVPYVQFWGQVGIPPIDDGPAEFMFSASQDYGKTWRSERQISMGSEGEFGKVMRLRGLGHFPDAMVMRVSISDPYELTIDAECEVQIS